MHKHCKLVLSYLKGKGRCGIEDIKRNTKMEKDEILWAIETLKSENLVDYSKRKEIAAEISPEGISYMDSFPEELLINDVYNKGKRAVKDITDNIALSWCKRNGWINIEAGFIKITDEGRHFLKNKDYPQRKLLNELYKNDGNDVHNLIKKHEDDFKKLEKRSLLEIKEHNSIKEVWPTENGLSLNLEGEDRVSELNREIIKTKAWEGQKFTEYDLDMDYGKLYPARIHPMHEFLKHVRNTWLSMGFIEGKGPIVNTAFWNFDTLFTPQNHPAREMHDTFFLSNPSESEVIEKEVVKKVKAAHEESFNYEWDYSTAKRHVLRTHNTVISAKYIKEFGNLPESKYPIKAFFLGRVFRNESVDYKHRAEFYQSDGIIIGNELRFSNLVFELKTFFAKLLGEKISDNIALRPSYFPFTEPSLEVFYYNKAHKDYVELGGAGIIREEITKALGTDKRVLAWGIGVDRLLLERIGINDINEIYRNKVDWLRERKGI